MNDSFRDQGTRDVYHGVPSKRARQTCPSDLQNKAQKKLELLLNFARSLDDLAAVPGNRLERLKGDRAGQHSIRINQQYRICFVWTDGGAKDIEIVDYH